jgi:hypothetical protein
MFLTPAAFNASFAQTAAVSEHTFDWIFFAIVGIPFVLVLFDTLINDGLRPRNLDGVERRYPPTVSDAMAAKMKRSPPGPSPTAQATNALTVAWGTSR